MSLAAEIEAKRAELRVLETRAALSCADGRHDWKHIGGANCGCDPDIGWCSLPVYQCQSCGDFDYGDNAEAERIKGRCECRSLALEEVQS